MYHLYGLHDLGYWHKFKTVNTKEERDLILNQLSQLGYDCCWFGV